MLRLACNIGLGFIFFSQMLLCFGGADGLTDFAFLGFGRARGGPAKAAVVGSSLVGTVSGAPMSNVFLTGSVTIPMMIRTGWKPEKAGAIEAVASSGGSIMPPIMGIAAFLIAERLNIKYSQVALAALIPAALYYLGTFIQVDLYAGKYNLKGLRGEEIPNGKVTFKKYWTLIPIFLLLIYLLFFNGMSAQGSAVVSALVALPLLAMQKENRKNFFKKLFAIFRCGGMTSMDIGCSMAAGGIIVGVVSFSGLGFTFGYILNTLAHFGVIFLLLGTAVCALILGMGMPAVAAYALTASLLASSLTKFGISDLAANMFIFYFSVISNITPPIAMAVFAAVSLSSGQFWKTGWEACKLAVTIYIVPFMFVFSESLLAQGAWARSF
jgi:TRAP transporter 4TM/12TM fusion protein